MLNNLDFKGIGRFTGSCVLIFFLVVTIPFSGLSQRSRDTDDLYENFKTPPNSAKPRVWWHWVNGNITRKGIRKDLEWMSRSGIGGFQTFDANLNTPQIVKRRLIFMTPEWKNAFKFATSLADSLHLEMGIAGSPGWSESGGPWVSPKDGMKKVVWNEERVKSGRSDIRILPPPDVTGPFQNIPMQGQFGTEVDASALPHYYQDIAVIAYRVSPEDRALNDLGAKVTSGDGDFSLEQLTNGDLTDYKLLPRNDNAGYNWILFTFPQPQTIKALTLVGGGNPGFFGRGVTPDNFRQLEYSDDGIHFHFVCNIPAGAIPQQTISIPVTKARYFRVIFKNPLPENSGLGELIGLSTKVELPKGTEVSELVLHPVEVINRFEEKAAFAPVGDIPSKTTRPAEDAVLPKDVINLTDRMNADGVLDWTVPDGDWEVIRFGYSLKGTTNHPATPEATGLEVDKLDPVAVKVYFTNYLNQYRDATGGLMGDKGGLGYMVTDSWEAGSLNWTEKLPEEFKKRRGYDIIPWLPVLTGVIVGSSESSEHFLYDFRKTLGDMVVDYHYDALTGILKDYGMKRYSESHESGRAFVADGMEVKRKAAIPMSAMWTKNPYMNGGDQTGYEADIRESASVAHIYGQNLVAAESLTALGVPDKAWSYSPENLKPTADLELASGLNRFVIHTSVHQPTDDKIPGLGLGPFGQWFNRHDTWAESAKVWTDYLSRSSYLLQQGHFVADILYYYGEDNNITSLFGKKLPDIPEGYSYDFINADALVNLISFKNGSLVTPSGMEYKVLVLDPNAARMSFPVIEKIRDLLREGAVVLGAPPVEPLGLEDIRNGEFNNLLQEVRSSSHFQANANLSEVLSKMGVVPDFIYNKPMEETKLMFIHRQLTDKDIYWINNRNEEVQNIRAKFRVTDKVPELWIPETGEIRPVSYEEGNGFTTVDLQMDPEGASFVVFRRQDAGVKHSEVDRREGEVLMEVDGPWEVSFQSDRGAPDHLTFDSLTYWNDNKMEGVKYFSGTAVYSRSFNMPENQLKGQNRIWLDLGDVHELAAVSLNGKDLGAVWHKPYRIDITDALQGGQNNLTVKVTNLWVNRLIGDAQPGNHQKFTYTTMPFYHADSKLLPSGLKGPVVIMGEVKIENDH